MFDCKRFEEEPPLRRYTEAASRAVLAKESLRLELEPDRLSEPVDKRTL
jgi:hypothetical protein